MVFIQSVWMQIPSCIDVLDKAERLEYFEKAELIKLCW